MKSFLTLNLLFLISIPFAVHSQSVLDYDKSVSDCTPGAYTVPEQLIATFSRTPAVITFKISGWDSGKCQISVTRIIQTQGQSSSLTFNCAFSKDDLNLLTHTVKNIQSGQISLDSSVTGIITSACSQL